MHRITLIPGDGIGPEVAESARRVGSRRLQPRLDLVRADVVAEGAQFAALVVEVGDQHGRAGGAVKPPNATGTSASSRARTPAISLSYGALIVAGSWASAAWTALRRSRIQASLVSTMLARSSTL